MKFCLRDLSILNSNWSDWKSKRKIVAKVSDLLFSKKFFLRYQNRLKVTKGYLFFLNNFSVAEERKCCIEHLSLILGIFWTTSKCRKSAVLWTYVYHVYNWIVIWSSRSVVRFNLNSKYDKLCTVLQKRVEKKWKMKATLR